MHYPAKRVKCFIDISADDDLSSAVNIGGACSIAIEWPSAMTSATAIIQGCNTVDGTYLNIEATDGTALLVTVTVSTIAALSLDVYEELLASINFVKLLMVGAEGADRTIYFHLGY